MLKRYWIEYTLPTESEIFSVHRIFHTDSECEYVAALETAERLGYHIYAKSGLCAE